MYEDLKKRITKKMGEDRQVLSTKEEKYIASWKDSCKMKDDIIMEAVTRAINIKGQKVSFAYIDAIIKSWAEKGVKSYSDILAIDEAYRKKKEKKADSKKNIVNEDNVEQSIKPKNNKIRIKLLSDTAKVPTYGTSGAAGADLYADIKEPIFVDFGHIEKISTGIAIEIPDGYVGLLFARSGLATKHGLAPANKTGVIDQDYRGPVIAAIQGCEPYDKEKESWQEYIERHTIYPGDRIGQLVIVPYFSADFEAVNSLEDTDRGEGGFGSTGTN